MRSTNESFALNSMLFRSCSSADFIALSTIRRIDRGKRRPFLNYQSLMQWPRVGHVQRTNNRFQDSGSDMK
jgi:hypothetical protein